MAHSHVKKIVQAIYILTYSRSTNNKIKKHNFLNYTNGTNWCKSSYMSLTYFPTYIF